MASSDLIIPPPAETLRPPIGLLIATGEPKPARGPGRSIPYFRFKAGQLDQYAENVEKADDVYGHEPTVLDDLLFLSDFPDQVLDIRLKCWGKSGLRGFGLTNFAALPSDAEFLERARAFDDQFMFRPREAKEVRPELREEWQGEGILGQLEGPDDPRIKKLEIRLEATLSVCMPKVMGIGTVALYSTPSWHNIKLLRAGVWKLYDLFHHLAGYPVKLQRRPRRTEYFDAEEKRYKPTTVHETVIDTAFTLQDVLDRIERREALGPGTSQRQLPPALPASIIGIGELPEDEDVRTRDEPTLNERPSDATLNRIAGLENEYGGDLHALRFGAYGVESADEMTPDQAAMYEQTLTRLVGQIEPAEVEIVDERGSVSFEDLLPDDVKASQT